MGQRASLAWSRIFNGPWRSAIAVVALVLFAVGAALCIVGWRDYRATTGGELGVVAVDTCENTSGIFGSSWSCIGTFLPAGGGPGVPDVRLTHGVNSDAAGSEVPAAMRDVKAGTAWATGGHGWVWMVLIGVALIVAALVTIGLLAMPERTKRREEPLFWA